MIRIILDSEERLKKLALEDNLTGLNNRHYMLSHLEVISGEDKDYYLAMADPMVDSFVYYSQVDQNELTKVGASFGLWKVSPGEKATSKKQSWSIFKYMDTNLSDPILNMARSTSEQMTGQKAAATRTFQRGTQTACGKYKLKSKLAKGWKSTSSTRKRWRSTSRHTSDVWQR